MEEQLDTICKPKIFEKAYNTHAKDLRNFMYYKCGDMDMAEDFVQDAFVKLWQNCAKVLWKKTKSFLFTVANNLFLNTISHKKVVLAHHKLTAKTNSTNETPEFILEEQEFLKKLQKAIADLPEKQREVFLLNRIDKKKYREIAELLEVSMKTVEKRMSDALRVLRSKIKEI